MAQTLAGRVMPKSLESWQMLAVHSNGMRQHLEHSREAVVWTEKASSLLQSHLIIMLTWTCQLQANPADVLSLLEESQS